MKKYILQLLALILVLAMALPAQNTSAAQVFTDVPTNHSNYEDITYLLDKGVVSTTKKTYGVKDIVTREEVAVMIAKAVKLDGTPRTTKFNDVPLSNPNSGYIQSAVEAGIINGFDEVTFKPNAQVTRGHMAAFISRAFDLPAGLKTFSDVKKGDTAYEAVSQLAAANITTGYDDGTFKPKNNLTRAHISAFLARAMQYQKDDEETPVTPVIPVTPVTPPVAKANMLVHFIDVGQGDSIFIQAPNGQNMLIDGGTKAYGDDIVAYLKSLNVSKVDYIVATHPDADHIGGLIDVIDSFKIGEFINSGKEHTTQTYEDLLTAVLNKNIQYTEPKVGDTIALDSDLKVQVLAVNAQSEDNNDASIVLKATYNKVSFLLTADASTEIEEAIAAKYDVTATILKAGHHGSSTSSSLAFLQKVNPSDVILSYGQDNSYGHPHDEVMASLKQIGAKAYSTAQDGTIVVTTNGQAYSIDAKVFTAPITVPSKPVIEVKPTPKPEPAPIVITPTPKPTGDINSGTYVIPGAPTSFKNCAAMREYYPHGVSSSHPAYADARDGDKDGWACEK